MYETIHTHTHCLKVSFKKLIFLFSILFLFLISNSPVSAYYTNMPASVVVGQPDFISSGSSTTQSSLSSSVGESFTDGQHLFVVDTINNRVLIWNKIPTINGAPADVVVGQPDFVSSTSNNGGVSAKTLNTPTGIYSDGTHLVVADSTNHRTLIWNSIPTTNFQAADVVVGQPDFVTTSSAVTASKSSDSFRVTIYNGKLFINDRADSRILIYNQIPTTNGAAADTVVGQDDFTSTATAIAANRFGQPRGVFVFNNKLFVTDFTGNRVLIFDPIPTTNGASASIVLGQPDFTSNTSYNGGVSCASMSSPDSVTATGNGRLILGETFRVLVFNSIPTSNFQSADFVLGQPSCTTTPVSNNGGLSASSLAGTDRIGGGGGVGNKLVVTDSGNKRVLIFNNTISSPSMNISLPLTPLNDGSGRLRVYGSVQLGERPNYALQWVKAEVNGNGLGYVTNLSGGRDNGTNQTLYDFYNDFNPGSVLNSDINNFTLLLTASSFNADAVSLFYFQPFVLNSVSSGTFNFSVNKFQIQKIKDNVDHFEVWVRSSPNSTWTQYISGISPNLIDTNTGQVTVTAATPGISFPNVVLPGIYDVKVRSVSKNGSSGFDTNTLSGISLSGTTGSGVSVTEGLVLQINSIDGNNSILSSFNPGSIKTNYSVSGFNPRVSGISWANSLVTLNITNTDNTTQTKTYTTKVNLDSSFTLFPSLYRNSILNFSVTKDGMYNFIPSFNLNQN